MPTNTSEKAMSMEAYLRHFSSRSTEIYSAGMDAYTVHPAVIQVMQKDGIDISGHTSNLVEEYSNIQFDFVLTVCDIVKSHFRSFPRARNFHYNFPDPLQVKSSEQDKLLAFQNVQFLIKVYCQQFADTYNL